MLLALVLALASVFGATGSAAASTNVSLNCIPQTVAAGGTTNCLAVVSSTGITPAGNVSFDATGYGNFGPGQCKLNPTGSGYAFCSLPVKTTVPGLQAIYASWNDGTHPAGSAGTGLNVTPNGSIHVECSPEIGFIDDLAICEALVPSSRDASASPTGTIQFAAQYPGVSGLDPGPIDASCVLQEFTGGSRCSVAFLPEVEGPIAIVANYGGDGLYPANRGFQIYNVREKHSVTITVGCDNLAPVLFNPITCTTTVRNEEASGGAPTGTVELENEKEGTFPGPSGHFCDLKAADPKSGESSCQIQFAPNVVGPQTLEAVFKGSSHFEFGREAIQIEPVAGHKTATKVTCTQSHGTSPGICTATVTDTGASPVAPEGKVTFRGPFEVKFGAEACQLTPTATAGVSQCGVSYTMTVVGNRTIFVDYLGNVALHQPSNAQGVAEGR
jgi:hypothetical protein